MHRFDAEAKLKGMTEEQFLSEFSEIVGAAPGEVAPNTELNTLEAWDSVSYLSAMVMIDEKCGVAIGPDTLVNAKTPGDIYAAVQTILRKAS